MCTTPFVVFFAPQPIKKQNFGIAGADAKKKVQPPSPPKPLPYQHGNCLVGQRNGWQGPTKSTHHCDSPFRPGLSSRPTGNYRAVLPRRRERVQSPHSPAGRARVAVLHPACHLCEIHPHSLRVIAGQARGRLAPPRQRERSMLLWLSHVVFFFGKIHQRGKSSQPGPVGCNPGLLSTTPPQKRYQRVNLVRVRCHFAPLRRLHHVQQLPGNV